MLFGTMASVQKIEKYGLQERTLTLLSEGHSHQEIAEILTKELEGRDTISQPAVSRWLKKVRRRRQEVVQPKVDKFLEETVESDLKCLQEMMDFQYQQFKGRLAADISGGQPRILGLKERNQAHDRLLEILKVKFRWMGIDGDQGTGDVLDPVDLSKFRNELKQEVKEAQNG